MDISKFLHLLAEDEGFKLDFKLKLSLEYEAEKKELAKDVIAIANTEGGRGYILFGIEDKTKRIVGLEDIPEDIDERIQQIIASRSMPPVPVSFKRIGVQDKVIGILTIYKSKQLPHQMTQNGVFYVRRGSTTDYATRYEVAKMLQYAGLLSFETVPCRLATVDDLDIKEMGKVLPYSISENRENTQLLLALGILAEKGHGKGYCPTYGGLLLFGKLPQLFIPQSILEVVISGKIEGIQGNILTMLKVFEEKVRGILPHTYPFEALYEIVANALIHRDYWNNLYTTHVEVKDDSIYIENPSCYSYEEGEKRHGRSNMWLYSRLLLLQPKNEVRHVGIGIEKARQMFRGKEGVRIELNQQSGKFQVTLPGLNYKEDLYEN